MTCSLPTLSSTFIYFLKHASNQSETIIHGREVNFKKISKARVSCAWCKIFECCQFTQVVWDTQIMNFEREIEKKITYISCSLGDLFGDSFADALYFLNHIFRSLFHRFSRFDDLLACFFIDFLLFNQIITQFFNLVHY